MPYFFTAVLQLFFGVVDGMLYALIAATILDYVTGVCVAIQKGKLSSEIGAKGIAKKVAMFALISISHIVDAYLIGSGSAVQAVATSFYLLNECLSVLENASKLGLPLPEKLVQIINSIRNDPDADKK